jgi:hypothetical protein
VTNTRTISECIYVDSSDSDTDNSGAGILPFPTAVSNSVSSTNSRASSITRTASRRAQNGANISFDAGNSDSGSSDFGNSFVGGFDTDSSDVGEPPFVSAGIRSASLVHGRISNDSDSGESGSEYSHHESDLQEQSERSVSECSSDNESIGHNSRRQTRQKSRVEQQKNARRIERLTKRRASRRVPESPTPEPMLSVANEAFFETIGRLILKLL